MMFPQPNDIYSSFSSFSPPNLNYGSLHDIVYSSSSATAANNPSQTPSLPPLVAAEAAPEKTASKASPPLLSSSDRPTKKDRHRKIYTAKGPRDRRMRLSLDVARKFFDLQDLLAFDKASTTVQWLLNKSKGAIKEHMAASKAKASASKCEELISAVSHENKRESPSAPPKVSKRTRNMRSRTSVKPKVARECRDKARARARERTLEKTKKMMMIQCGGQDEGNEGSKEPLAFNGLQEVPSSHELKSSLEMLAVVDKQYCSNTSPIHHKEPDGDGSVAVFDYNDAVENLFQDPWEMDLMEYINERVLLGELWDANNTISV